MLREMDFVEGDWAALFWAVGSATALFKHFEAPMTNLSDVFARTQALMKKIRRRTLVGYAVCFVVIVFFGSFIFIPLIRFNALGLVSPWSRHFTWHISCMKGAIANCHQKLSLRLALPFTERYWSDSATFTVDPVSGRAW